MYDCYRFVVPLRNGYNTINHLTNTSSLNPKICGVHLWRWETTILCYIYIRGSEQWVNCRNSKDTGHWNATASCTWSLFQLSIRFILILIYESSDQGTHYQNKIRNTTYGTQLRLHRGQKLRSHRSKCARQHGGHCQREHFIFLF
jgi:hypothetical protein